jgi:hypothetical protein
VLPVAHHVELGLILIKVVYLLVQAVVWVVSLLPMGYLHVLHVKLACSLELQVKELVKSVMVAYMRMLLVCQIVINVAPDSTAQLVQQQEVGKWHVHLVIWGLISIHLDNLVV